MAVDYHAYVKVLLHPDHHMGKDDRTWAVILEAIADQRPYFPTVGRVLVIPTSFIKPFGNLVMLSS